MAHGLVFDLHWMNSDVISKSSLQIPILIGSHPSTVKSGTSHLSFFFQNHCKYSLKRVLDGGLPVSSDVVPTWRVGLVFI